MAVRTARSRTGLHPVSCCLVNGLRGRHTESHISCHDYSTLIVIRKLDPAVCAAFSLAILDCGTLRGALTAHPFRSTYAGFFIQRKSPPTAFPSSGRRSPSLRRLLVVRRVSSIWRDASRISRRWRACWTLGKRGDLYHRQTHNQNASHLKHLVIIEIRLSSNQDWRTAIRIVEIAVTLSGFDAGFHSNLSSSIDIRSSGSVIPCSSGNNDPTLIVIRELNLAFLASFSLASG